MKEIFTSPILESDYDDFLMRIISLLNNEIKIPA